MSNYWVKRHTWCYSPIGAEETDYKWVVKRRCCKGGMGRIENKKGGVNSTFFAPNLTMNLTYLCYGESKVRGPIGGTRKRR